MLRPDQSEYKTVSGQEKGKNAWVSLLPQAAPTRHTQLADRGRWGTLMREVMLLGVNYRRELDP